MTRFFISGALLRTALLAGTVALVAAGCAAAEEPSSTAAPASDGTGTTAASVAEETTTTAAPAPTDRGSREAPIAAGESVVVGDWEVTVLSAIPNATEAVLTENQFNDPPADGRQFYIVEVAATYQGDASEAIFAGLTITTVGDAAVAYENFEDTCGVIPNELDTFSEVFPGGTQTGNLCWSVRSDDATSLVLIVDHALSFDQDRAYLALVP